MMKLRWPDRTASSVARALTGHATLGLAAAALLYILTLSGLLAVFSPDLQRWEQPSAPEMAVVDPDAVAQAARSALDREGEPTHHLFIHLPTDRLPRLVVTTDRGGRIADAAGRPAGPEAHPWTQFLLDLHYYLHLPQTAGLTFVGLLGVLLLALGVSGFLAHPRIFRDAFAVRLGSGPRTLWADLHNRLSVWTAPFHLSIALTGAVLGLTGATALALAQVTDSTQAEIFGQVFGPEPSPDDRPAPLADIAGALRAMEATYPEVTPVYVLMDDPGTAGQHLQILAEHPYRLGFGDYYTFDAQGRFQGSVGMMTGTAGQQAIAAMYRLHFGTFAGGWVRAAYGLFGLGLAIIIASGLNIYLARRTAQGRPAERLAGAWSAVVWGTPAMLALALLALTAGLACAALPWLFWLGLAILLGLGTVAPNGRRRMARSAQAATGALLLAALVMHGAAAPAAFSAPAGWPVTLGLALTASGFLICAAGRRAARTVTRMGGTTTQVVGSE